MKRLIKVIAAIAAGLMVSAAAEAQTNETPKKFSESLQFGVNYRIGSPSVFCSEETATISGGYRFNRKNYLGLTLGISDAEWYNDAEPADYPFTGYPIALDYIHYFPLGKAKNHSIYLGGEVGILYSNEVAKVEYGDGDVELGSEIIMLKTGMDFRIYKNLHINFGLRIGLLCGGVSCGISF